MDRAYLIELIDQLYEVLAVCQGILCNGNAIPDGFLDRLNATIREAEEA